MAGDSGSMLTGLAYSSKKGSTAFRKNRTSPDSVCVGTRGNCTGSQSLHSPTFSTRSSLPTVRVTAPPPCPMATVNGASTRSAALRNGLSGPFSVASTTPCRGRTWNTSPPESVPPENAYGSEVKNEKVP